MNAPRDPGEGARRAFHAEAHHLRRHAFALRLNALRRSEHGHADAFRGDGVHGQAFVICQSAVDSFQLGGAIGRFDEARGAGGVQRTYEPVDCFATGTSLRARLLDESDEQPVGGAQADHRREYPVPALDLRQPDAGEEEDDGENEVFHRQ